MVTAKDVADKWARRLKGATEDIRKGVDEVTTAPTKKAAEKVEKFKAELLRAIDEGKWVDGLNRVSLEDWKAAMKEVGVGRIASGVDKNLDKMEEFMNELLPYIDSVKKKVEALPDVTLEDRINRMNTFIREMAKFKRK